MFSPYEAEIIEKGIELSWTTWSKMCGHTLVSGDISYLKFNTVSFCSSIVFLLHLMHYMSFNYITRIFQ